MEDFRLRTLMPHNGFYNNLQTRSLYYFLLLLFYIILFTEEDCDAVETSVYLIIRLLLIAMSLFD